MRAAGGRLDALAPRDVQRTLCELTVQSVADALRREAPATRRLIVCGGGAANAFLTGRLAAALPRVVVEGSAHHGLDPQAVEGAGFAWFACRRVRGETASLPGVTGASRASRLGGLFNP